jgi:hypothetical protein
LNFGHLKRFAQTLERAKFDAFFMADHLAVLNMALDALKHNHTVTSFGPFTLLSALAVVTEHLGLIAAGSTMFDALKILYGPRRSPAREHRKGLLSAVSICSKNACSNSRRILLTAELGCGAVI